MKLKYIFACLLMFVFIFSALTASAMTDQEKQALIQSIKQQIALLQAQVVQMLSQQASVSSWCHNFNMNITSASEVFALQTALKKQGYTIDSAELATMTYGVSTAQAVTGFQEKYKANILTPYGLSRGTGFAGASTRAKLNQLYACDSTAGNTTNTTTTITSNTSQVSNSSSLTTISICKADCKTQANGIFAVSCSGVPTKCSSGYVCQKTFDTSYADTNSDGTIETIEKLTGAKCVKSSSIDTGSATTCKARCASQSNGIFAINCSGVPTKCSVGYTCENTYSTKNEVDSITGYVSEVQTLTGTRCVSPSSQENNNNNSGVCVESNWTSSLSPTTCPSSNQQTKTWTKIGTCTGGVSHPYSETVACNSQALTCTSWTYSAWTACSASGVKTRTVSSAFPSGCVGGSPDTSDECIYTAVCSEDNWTSSVTPTVCPSSNRQTKTWTKVGTCTGGVTHPSSETVACSCVATWECDNEWGVCSNNLQTRNCWNTNGCGASTKTEEQYCCVSNWQCGSWNSCASSSQSRTCVDLNACAIPTDLPDLTKYCNCTPEWSCTAWGSCSAGKSTRICTTTNGCGNTANKPIESQPCIGASTLFWDCNSWGSCYTESNKSYQGRICTNSFGVTDSKPLTKKLCSLPCAPDWRCEGWSVCANSQKTRTCYDVNYCGTGSANTTVETQTCTSCVPSINCTTGSCGIGHIRTITCNDGCGNIVSTRTESCNP